MPLLRGSRYPLLGSAPPRFPLDLYKNDLLLALSCQRVLSSFTGPIAALRRQADNATTDLYLDETSGEITPNSPVSAGGTLAEWVTSSQAFVSQLYEQSNGRHATQSVNGSQGELLPNGMAGRGTIQFANDFMRVSDFAFNNQRELTIFLVINSAGDNVILSHWQFGTVPLHLSWEISRDAATDTIRVLVSGDGITTHLNYRGSTNISYGCHCIEVVFKAGDLRIYVNGVEETLTKTTDIAITEFADSSSDLGIGAEFSGSTGSSIWSAKLGAIFVINRALTAVQRQQIRTWLNERSLFSTQITTIDDSRFARIGGTSGAIIIAEDGSNPDIHETSNILHEPSDAGEEYKYWITGRDPSNEHISYFYSSDGVTWTPHASNPVIATAQRRAEDPFIIKISSTYYLFSEDSQTGQTAIAQYSATNPEGPWTYNGNLTLANCSSPTIIRSGSTWYLFYERMTDTTIALATATDPTSLSGWTDQGQVFGFADVPWGEVDTIVPDDIILKGTRWFLIYHAKLADIGKYNVGICYSDNLTDWTDLGRPIQDDEDQALADAQIFNDGTNDVLLYTLAPNGSSVRRGYPLKIAS
jgi:hypothetical protein